MHLRDKKTLPLRHIYLPWWASEIKRLWILQSKRARFPKFCIKMRHVFNQNLFPLNRLIYSLWN